jgi:ubiquitin C-terminal hydrolase
MVTSAGSTEFVPRVFYDAVTAALPEFSGGIQCDATEFFNQLLLLVPNYRRFVASRAKSTAICLNCDWPSPQDWTHVTPVTVAIDGFHLLQECLDEFVASADVTIDCEKCQKNSPATNKWELEVGDIAVFSLKRFRFLSTGIKDTHLVTYPPTLQLRWAGDSGLHDYELLSILCHIGETPSSGHYIAYTASGDGVNCVLLDDGRAPKELPFAAMMSLPDAYVVVYRRKTAAESAALIKVRLDEAAAAATAALAAAGHHPPHPAPPLLGSRTRAAAPDTGTRLHGVAPAAAATTAPQPVLPSDGHLASAPRLPALV